MQITAHNSVIFQHFSKILSPINRENMRALSHIFWAESVVVSLSCECRKTRERKARSNLGHALYLQWLNDQKSDLFVRTSETEHSIIDIADHILPAMIASRQYLEEKC